MLTALTRLPSPRLSECQLTYLERAPIDFDRILAEHAAYRQTLAGCGANVIALQAEAEFPDCAFVEDTAVVLDEFAVICRSGTTSRRGEESQVAAILQSCRLLKQIVAPATLEGGDVLRLGKTLFVGLSSRTNAAGIEQLAEFSHLFDYTVRTVRVHGCLHFKTACTALPDGRLLVNPDWIDMTALHDFPVVTVPVDEPWAANVVVLGDEVIAEAGHEQTIEMLGILGFVVHPVPLGEFAKAEGGTTCLSLLYAD
jgi:dimethylargininase